MTEFSKGFFSIFFFKAVILFETNIKLQTLEQITEKTPQELLQQQAFVHFHK